MCQLQETIGIWGGAITFRTVWHQLAHRIPIVSFYWGIGPQGSGNELVINIALLEGGEFGTRRGARTVQMRTGLSRVKGMIRIIQKPLAAHSFGLDLHPIPALTSPSFM
jgi:hypothetical protein